MKPPISILSPPPVMPPTSIFTNSPLPWCLQLTFLTHPFSQNASFRHFYHLPFPWRLFNPLLTPITLSKSQLSHNASHRHFEILPSHLKFWTSNLKEQEKNKWKKKRMVIMLTLKIRKQTTMWRLATIKRLKGPDGPKPISENTEDDCDDDEVD